MDLEIHYIVPKLFYIWFVVAFQTQKGRRGFPSGCFDQVGFQNIIFLNVGLTVFTFKMKKQYLAIQTEIMDLPLLFKFVHASENFWGNLDFHIIVWIDKKKIHFNSSQMISLNFLYKSEIYFVFCPLVCKKILNINDG